ncbi:MAG TPA: VTT domain-containing protein [Baekduia sp.]|nr:VTT domain-containing protein [Baekduia sp.]
MKLVPLLGAAALALFLVLRRRRLEPTLLAGGGIGVVLLLVYGSGLVHLPNIQKLLEDVGSALGQWTYLVVGLMAFFETGAFVGLLAPGETFLIFGGVIAGQGTISLAALIAIVWAAAVAGDLASFYAGRKLGRAFLERHGPKVSITEERLRTVEGFFGRHGGKAVLLGRFVGLVRAILPFLAGSSGMPLRRFLPYDVVGAGVWASGLLVLGYVFWQSFDRVLHYAERGTLALGTTIVVLAAILWAWRRLRHREERERLAAWVDAQLDRPLLRPLGAVLRPAWRWSRGPLRFVRDRLTPGELGLEVTTLLAFVVVGAYAFFAYGFSLDHGTLLPGDSRAFALGANVRAQWLTHVAKVVTAFGSSPVVGAATLVTVVVLLARRRGVAAATLAVGALATFGLVHLAKAGFDRSRPPHGLVDTVGQSFPSGHAAYAVAWVVIAVLLTRGGSGFARASAVVVAAVALAVLIAATRVYLRAHYLSDVVGGAGLAAAVFGLCGIVGLVVAHVRHNGARS